MPLKIKSTTTGEYAHSQTAIAAVSVTPASRPNAATPSAKRKACRIRSRSSCTSTASNSSRFSPMVASRRTNFFEVVASWPRLTVDSSIMKSIAFAGAAACDQITDDRPDADADGDGLIRIFADGLVGDLGTGDGLVADIGRDVFGAVQCGGETLAGLPDFFAGHVGGGGQEFARVFGERAEVVTDGLGFFVHTFFV